LSDTAAFCPAYGRLFRKEFFCMVLNVPARRLKAVAAGFAAVSLLLIAGCTSVPTRTTVPADAYSWGHPGCPCTSVLRPGSPSAAGLLPQALDDIDGTVSRILVRRVTPGAVVLVARRGTIAKWSAYGYASIYKNDKYDAVANPLAMQKDEIFDLASVSKLFTATAIMQLWDQGKFKLDDPVAKYLPRFGAHGKEHVTIKELLTHTSGFQPDPTTPLYKVPGTRKDRLDYVLGLPLKYAPGSRYVYSDINFIVLGALIEHLSGTREDAFIHQHLSQPLDMADTMYDPPANLKPRIAASEYQPWTDRGLLWGQVDDENAWALGGVAGHAGLFSSARDLAVFGQMMLNGGTYNGVRVLSQRAVKLLLTDFDKKFPGNSTGLGWSIDRDYFMGALSGPDTAGHEGFTGTTIVIDTKNDVVGVLLMNRVHPTRNGASDVVARREVSTDIANAIPGSTPGAGTSWFSGYGNELHRKLTAKVGTPGRMLSFKTWYRTEPDKDFGIVEASADGTHWSLLGRLTGSSDGWQTKEFALPADANYIRFDYQTDARINGRGWYLHDVQVDGHEVRSFQKSGWVRRDD
jgi:CubicO group peptidase (beta-lactamase class C family)